MKRESRARLDFLLTRLVTMAVDAAVVVFSFYAAVVFRFNFWEPRWGWRAMAWLCLLFAAVEIAALAAVGVLRRPWRRVSVKELPRFALAAALSAAVFALLRILLPRMGWYYIIPPYSVTVMTALLSTGGFLAVRFFWRGYWRVFTPAEPILNREERVFDNSLAARFLSGRTVLVTGAGGTIGSEIVRQVAAAGARRIVLVERCENALYQIDRAMREAGHGERIRPVMRDCGDRAAMTALFAEEKPAVVLHAAACKHVPMVELNPEEGRRNNVEATRCLAEVSAAAGVSRFVMISTDKAVNPVSVMGRTKREAEEIVLSQRGETSFCAVRFGNVFGSSGSVVPLFREQIAKGGPVTVTHPDMRRYFMTVAEAVSLVLQAASRSERAIYTLDMGESVAIVDLAEGMIREAGLRPYVDIPIVFTGIRPGEKLFEELDISEKSAYRTDMAKIYITRA